MRIGQQLDARDQSLQQAINAIAVNVATPSAVSPSAAATVAPSRKTSKHSVAKHGSRRRSASVSSIGSLIQTEDDVGKGHHEAMFEEGARASTSYIQDGQRQTA